MLRDAPAEGAWNMAADEALARSRGEGEAVLRLYEWSAPTVSFGRNEAASELYDPRRASGRLPASGSGVAESGVGESGVAPSVAAPGSEAAVAFVRRPTGGRSVLHHRELTYGVALPLPRRGLRAVYRRIHEAVAEGLRSMGLRVDLAPDPERAPGLDAGACFAAAAGGEVLLAGRKLVGSAQARVGGSLLQHGSILLEGGQELLDELRGSAAPAPASAEGSADRSPAGSPAASVGEALGRVPSAAELGDALSGGFRALFPGSWRDSEWDPGARDLARRLLDRYRSVEWTWRR